MQKGLLSLTIVLFAALVLVAPQARAEFMPRDYRSMHSEDADKTLMVLKHLKHHPYMVKELDAERIHWILKGFERLARMPFVDHDALFDLQFKLTMHLLDLQIAKLGHWDAPKPYGFEPERAPIKLAKPFQKDWGIEKIDSFHFHSAMGCQMNQSKVARQNAWKRNIFVGPCQSDYGPGYSFNVWNVNR